MAIPFLFENFATVWLTTVVGASDTSIELGSGEGALFPLPGVGEKFAIVLEDNRIGAREVAYCIGRSGDTLTVQRAQEGTTALEFAAYSSLSNRVTAGVLSQLLTGNVGPEGPEGPEGPPGPPGSGVDDLADLPQGGATDGDVLTWNDGTGEWEPQAPAAGGLADAPSDGERYGRRDAAWVILNAEVMGSPKTGNFTLAASDSDIIPCDLAGTITATIPPNSDVPFPVGTIREFVRMGTGPLVIAAGSGVTLIKPADLNAKARAQYSSVFARKESTDTWRLLGDLEPAANTLSLAVEDSGFEAVAAATRINFTGAGVTVTDAGGGEATVDIPGGGGGGGGNPNGVADTTPTLTDFAWVNQGDATATQRSYGIGMKAPRNSADNVRALVRSAPSTPYSIAVRLRWINWRINYTPIGLAWRDSASGKLQVFSVGTTSSAPSFELVNWTNPTTFASTTVAPAPFSQNSSPEWMRLRDNGTNRMCDLSTNGEDWTTIFSVGRTNHLTPDQVGFFINPIAASAVPDILLTIHSWAAS